MGSFEHKSVTYITKQTHIGSLYTMVMYIGEQFIILGYHNILIINPLRKFTLVTYIDKMFHWKNNMIQY